MSILNRHDKMLTDIVILDTTAIANGPVAIIELPFRLRSGIHGSWVEHKDLPEGDLCDSHGISNDIQEEFRKRSYIDM